MNTRMAKATNIDTGIEFLLGIMTLKEIATMQFTRN